MSARPIFLRVACLVAATSSWVDCGRKTPLPPPGSDAGPDLMSPKVTDAPSDNAVWPEIDTGLPGPDTGLPHPETGLPGLETGTSPPDVPGSNTDVDAPGLAVDLPLAASCTTGLSGAAPFGAQVSGTGTFPSPIASSTAAPITSIMTAYVYFPAGRVAGGQALLAMQSRVVQGLYFFGSPVTIAGDLSATGLSVSGHDETITAELLPGADGLRATIAANFSSPGTDVGDDRTGTLTMCPSGDAPAPSMQVIAAVLSPLATLSLNLSTPLAANALDALRITSPLGDVPVKTAPNTSAGSRYASGPNFTITASSAFPPGQPLTIDASQVRDVLGRPVPVTNSGTLVLTTSDVLSDLSLATTPPSGAVAGSGCISSAFAALDAAVPSNMSGCAGGGITSSGSVTFKKGGLITGTNVDGLLALPATTATKLRVRMSVGDPVASGTSCQSDTSYASIARGLMAVVGPNGETSATETLMCDGNFSDHVLALPSASPLWLTIHLEGFSPVPFMLPPSGTPPVILDALELM